MNQTTGFGDYSINEHTVWVTPRSGQVPRPNDSLATLKLRDRGSVFTVEDGYMSASTCLVFVVLVAGNYVGRYSYPFLWPIAPYQSRYLESGAC
jgi:hypothetical protein